ncbi:hypothetical protein [Chryseobacterium aquaticum]|uniref:Uncharacterized protein n=1 Tax=Chryseobacterium aquaticum subsp. greenlandense TaxID=345663 RepID=A0A124F306_9FLAO|nr:hypothetical protein [Chryseobacterium aquaticum]KUJ56430.1 hypothetical protein AR686_07665 [Chryseobacterium aquaticum subsp. greenlandense]
MQSNDLSGLLSLQDLSGKDFFISPFESSGNTGLKQRINELKELKIPLSKEKATEIQNVVSKYENLGKSRRWIRRYIKRKFNITEY